MAFLKPANLQLFTAVIPGAAVTDAVLGFARQDMKIFYIDVIVPDIGASFTGGTLLLEYDDGASGADTEIDTITLAGVADLDTNVTLDDLTLTTGIVPAGSRILGTVADVTGISENFLVVHIWFVALDAQ